MTCINYTCNTGMSLNRGFTTESINWVLGFGFLRHLEDIYKYKYKKNTKYTKSQIIKLK